MAYIMAKGSNYCAGQPALHAYLHKRNTLYGCLFARRDDLLDLLLDLKPGQRKEFCCMRGCRISRPRLSHPQRDIFFYFMATGVTGTPADKSRTWHGFADLFKEKMRTEVPNERPS